MRLEGGLLGSHREREAQLVHPIGSAQRVQSGGSIAESGTEDFGEGPHQRFGPLVGVKAVLGQTADDERSVLLIVTKVEVFEEGVQAVARVGTPRKISELDAR